VVFKVQVAEPLQLFSAVDPASLSEKSLDSSVEEYFTEALESLGLNLPLRIEVLLPREALATPEAQVIPVALANYFHYRALQKRRALRKTLSQGRWSLLVSMVFMCVCLGASYGLEKLFALSTKTEWVAGFVSSALDIASWVAMWDPINMLLHAWRPIRREYKMYLKLRDTAVRVKEAPQQEEIDTIRMQMANLPAGIDIRRAVSRPGFEQLVRRHQRQTAQADPNMRTSISLTSLPAAVHVEHRRLLKQGVANPVPVPRRSMSVGPNAQSTYGPETSEVATPGAPGTAAAIATGIEHVEGMVSSPQPCDTPFVVVHPCASAVSRAPASTFDA